MSDELREVYRKGLESVDELKIDETKAALARIAELGKENSVHGWHLKGMLAWAEGDYEHAAGYLMQAADAGESMPEVYLDCAELEMELGEMDEAEAALRVLLGLDDIPAEKADEGRLLLAQVRRFDDDPHEALEILEEVSSSLKDHPYYHSARASVLLELDRAADALEEMEIAIKAAPEDPDLHWELGVAASVAGNSQRSREAMLETWRLDEEDREDAPLEEDQRGALRAAFEGVLEDFPDELLKLVAGVPIEVERSLSREEVEAGADPRNPLLFLGTPATDDADGQLTGMRILRDVLLDAIDDDEELPEMFFQALMVEMRRFFRLEKLTVVNVGG